MSINTVVYHWRFTWAGRFRILRIPTFQALDCLVPSKDFAASFTGWPVQFDPVMPECVRIGFTEAGHAIVLVQGRLESTQDVQVFKRQSMSLSKLFAGTHALAEQLLNPLKLYLIQHGNIPLTSPAPEDLH
jgi:hypothetical protein